MQLQLVRTTRQTRQFDEIVRDFTPPMQRVCRHMAATDLRQMIERMALHQLAEEQRRCARPCARRASRLSSNAARH